MVKHWACPSLSVVAIERIGLAFGLGSTADMALVEGGNSESVPKVGAQKTMGPEEMPFIHHSLLFPAVGKAGPGATRARELSLSPLDPVPSMDSTAELALMVGVQVSWPQV